MMKKYYFVKFLAIAMMFTGLSLTSCDENDNAIINGEVWIKPEVKLVGGGAVVTASTISDLNRMIGRLKEEIKEAAEAGETFSINIETPKLDATESEHAIIIPTSKDADIVVNFTNAISTDVPLLIESMGAGNNATPAFSTNEVEINFASGTSGIDLELNMPTSTVTLKGATFNELIANTALNTLIIESGVTVDWLLVKDGNVVVKNGGKILGAIASGWHDIFVDGIPIQNVFENEVLENPEYEDFLHVKNLKFKKSDNDELIVYHLIIHETDEDAEKDVAEVGVIIEEGAHVTLNGTYPNNKYYPIVNISGEGDNAKLYAKGHHHENRGPEDIVPDGALEANIDLRVINKLSNLTIDLSTCLIWSEEEYPTIGEEAETEWAGNIQLPQSSENCNFKAHDLNFQGNNVNNITTNSASFKNCTFESIANEGEENYEPSIVVGFPIQTEDRTSFDLSFDTCNFDQVFKFFTWFNGGVDDFEDYVGSITLDNTKMAGKAVTKDTEMIAACWPVYDEENEKYLASTIFIIDGKKYKPIQDEQTGKWLLIEAK